MKCHLDAHTKKSHLVEPVSCEIGDKVNGNPNKLKHRKNAHDVVDMIKEEDTIEEVPLSSVKTGTVK